MQRNKRPRQRGFTLAEILVTTAIFAIIMIAALTIYDKSNRVFKSGVESADMQQSTRIGFDKLVADLRMTGFDYNRGGDPTGAGQFTQPDEQIEYAGRTAVVIRGNFNYNTASSTGNGLEPDYTPTNASGSQIFPYVTTSNDEIVAYVLRSADNSKNTGAISFYVDSSKPRKAYPGAGGAAETKITIDSSVCGTCGIDTTNANPPYTLYRQTVTDILNGVPGTPVSENIRSLNFFYYTDTNGTQILKNSDSPVTDIATTRDAGGTASTSATATLANEDGTTTTAYTGAIGGDGQYNPASPGTAANFADRQSRVTIQSIRVNLIGMNASPEPNYAQKSETIATIKNYRQYTLSALVVPRNIGLTGFPEPSNTAPGSPAIRGICVAACAAPVICWTAPTGGGPVLQYRIEWDTSLNGSFSNFVNVADPTATSLIIPDNGSMDPSLTWYYHVIAQNDNGSSTPDQYVTAQPRNSTKPMPPSSMALSRPTNYAVTLGWTSPSTNDPSVATSSCSGTGCAADPATIPSQELIHYRIYRGLTANFDPAVSPVAVLTTGSAGQPVVAPGSTGAWVDSAATSAFPPGTCVPYYYRMQAADRCVLSDTYNSGGGGKNDSLSTIVPPVGSSATGPLQATDLSTALATAPLSLKVTTATSACPAPLSTNCRIDLTWGRVTNDNAGNAIGVDRYRVTRYRKKQTDPSFALDTTWNLTGYQDYSGYSQTSSAGVIGISDTSAPATDSVDSKQWYYEYTVAAKDCRLGLVSTPVDFPSPCTVNPVIVEAGASNGTDTADTPLTAWVMNAGDTITVSPPSGITLTSVTFAVTTYPGALAVDTPPPDTTSPFQYSWTDRTDAQIYKVTITVVTNTGCSEVHVKYVKDQAAVSCAFANQALIAYSSATSGSTTTLSETYTLTNLGSDPMQVASKAINVTWAIPAGDTTHSDMTMTAIAYPSTTDNFSGVGPGTVSRFIPAGIANIPAGGTLTITVRWQYKKQDDPPALAGQPLSKICLDYAIASEAGVTKHCNLVGQSGSTNNPGSCD
jgi:prepilin-type N-terminal cleavage/methylation domain-containing protein